jgi:DNA primase large subunit
VDYDIGKLGKYPFLSEAREYVGSLGLSLGDLLDHPVYSACVETGRKRLLDAINGSYSPDLSDPLSMQLTVLSYPVARMLVNSLNNRFLLEKYSRGEAASVYRLLDGEDRSVVDEIVSDLKVEYAGGRMPLAEYLRLVKYLVRESGKWKLVNRVVDAGMIEVGETDFKLLLREAVKLRVMEPVDLKNIPDRLKVMAKNLSAPLTGSREVVDIKNVDENALPECIRKMITMLETGTASHNAMFILATFFLNLGLDKEDVLSIFSRSPAYKEEVTRYQLEFLAGEKGGTEYTCPSCETIKSYGLGCSDCTFKHPLQRYRLQARRNKPRKSNLKKSRDNR